MNRKLVAAAVAVLVSPLLAWSALGADASLAMALFGAGVFAAGPMYDLNRALQPPSSGGTGCGSGGSGCGGGCGGGGCGGCGGGD